MSLHGHAGNVPQDVCKTGATSRCMGLAALWKLQLDLCWTSVYYLFIVSGAHLPRSCTVELTPLQWFETHTECNKNYNGTSGGMEVAAAEINPVETFP